MRREDALKVAAFLLNAIVLLAVWNVRESIAAVKELLVTRVEYVEKRLETHQAAQGIHHLPTYEQKRLDPSGGNAN